MIRLAGALLFAACAQLAFAQAAAPAPESKQKERAEQKRDEGGASPQARSLSAERGQQQQRAKTDESALDPDQPGDTNDSMDEVDPQLEEPVHVNPGSPRSAH